MTTQETLYRHRKARAMAVVAQEIGATPEKLEEATERFWRKLAYAAWVAQDMEDRPTRSWDDASEATRALVVAMVREDAETAPADPFTGLTEEDQPRSPRFEKAV